MIRWRAPVITEKAEEQSRGCLFLVKNFLGSSLNDYIFSREIVLLYPKSNFDMKICVWKNKLWPKKKYLPWDTRNPGSIPELRRSPGVGNSNPLQYSCLENPKDRGAWWIQSMGLQRIGRYGACLHSEPWVHHPALTGWPVCSPQDCEHLSCISASVAQSTRPLLERRLLSAIGCRARSVKHQCRTLSWCRLWVKRLTCRRFAGKWGKQHWMAGESRWDAMRTEPQSRAGLTELESGARDWALGSKSSLTSHWATTMLGRGWDPGRGCVCRELSALHTHRAWKRSGAPHASP